jgi:tetratricopeptide (TPR) repeat protein
MKLDRLTIGSLLLLSLTLIAALFKPGFLWGINHLAYLPLLLACVIIAFCVLIYLIIVKITVGQTTGKPSKIYHKSGRRVLIIVLITIMLLLILYNFQSATQLWGDGYLRANETEKGRKIYFTEPLDKFTQYLVYNSIGKTLNLTSIESHQMVSIFGGLLFFLICLWIIGQFAKTRLERLLLGSLVFSSGLIQLYFGYVESYSLATPLFLLSIGMSFSEYKKNQPLIMGQIVFFIACLFHMSLLAYFPAFMITTILILKSNKKNINILAVAISAMIPILSILIVIALSRIQLGNSFQSGIFNYLLISLLPNDTGYWLFSPSHLLDIVNQLLLVSPAAMIILFTSSPFRQLSRKTPVYIFLLVLSGCGLLFLLLFNTAFGIGRDWDLFSSVAIPLNILAAYLLAEKVKSGSIRSRKIIFLPILSAMIITISFVVGNSRIDSSLNRYRDIIDQNTYAKPLNLENLSNYYVTIADTANYHSILREAGEIWPHPRYYHKIAQSYLALGMTEAAIKNYYLALELDSSYIPSLTALGFVFGQIGIEDPRSLALAEKFLVKSLEFDSNNSGSYFNLGMIYLQAHKHDEGVAALKKAIKLDPNYLEACSNLGLAYMQAQVYDSAELYYKLVLDKDRKQFSTYLSLAKLYHETNDKSRAVVVLNEALTNFDSAPDRIEIAKAFAMLGAFEKSIMILTTVTDTEERPLESFITLANLYHLLDRDIEAMNVISSARRYHQNTKSRLIIAETFLQLKANDSAEVCFNEVIIHDKTYTEGYHKFALYYMLQGDSAKAREMLELGLNHITNPLDRERLLSTLAKIPQN